MLRFWVSNAAITLVCVLVFLFLLYTVGVYEDMNIYGHYGALFIIGILGVQLVINLVSGLIFLEKHNVFSGLLGMFSIALSVLALLYTFNTVFIQS